MTSGLTHFIFLCIFAASLAQRCSEVVVVDSGDSGHWQGRVLINVPEAVNGWTVKLEFDNVVTSIDSALATVTGSLTSWTLTSRGFDDEIEAGTVFELGFIVYFSGSEPTVIFADFNEDLLCDEETHNPTTTTEGSEGGDCTDVAVVDTEASGYWQGRLLVYVPQSVNGWTVLLELDSPATAIESALASISGSGTSWTLTSRGFDDELEGETIFELGIIVRFSGASPRAVSVQFNENSLCDGGSPATTTTEGSQDACDDDDVEVETIYNNYWQGWIRINVPEDVSSWTVKVHFNSDVDSVETALASVSGEGSLWTLTSKSFDGDLSAGTLLEIGIIVHFSSSNAPYINNLIFNDDLVCSGGNAPTTSIPTDPPTETTPKTTKTTTKPTTSSTTTNGNFDVSIISWIISCQFFSYCRSVLVSMYLMSGR